ncbi:MAG: hypothetical protein ACFWT2_12075 [Thermoanaerobacterium thermosaccharolyticum]
MTNPIQRQRNTKQLIYITLYFSVILFFNFLFSASRFFDLTFLRVIVLFLDITVLISGIIKTYKVIGSL